MSLKAPFADSPGYLNKLYELYGDNNKNRRTTDMPEDNPKVVPKNKAEQNLMTIFGANSREYGEEQILKHREQEARTKQAHLEATEEAEENNNKVFSKVPSSAEPRNKLYWDWWKKMNPNLANHPQTQALIEAHKEQLGLMFHSSSPAEKAAFDKWLRDNNYK